MKINYSEKSYSVETLGLQIYFGKWFLDVWSAKKVKQGKDFVLFSIGK